jgi:two-component system, OmpR family, response regulator VicR
MDNVRILVVDDNPDIIETIEEIFKAKWPNASVSGARSGLDAMRIMAEEAPDAVLLDIMMPEVDGWSVASKMHENPHLKDVPILYVTAKIDDLSRRMGQISSEDYITKPFQADDLVRRTQKVIVRYKYMKNHAYLLTYGLLDAITLMLPAVALTVYMMLTGAEANFNPRTVAFWAMVAAWLAGFAFTMLAMDFILSKAFPKIREDKRTLHRANTAYWQNNTGKLLLEAIPLWLASFIPALIIHPTTTTLPIYVLLPGIWGIYRIGYKPVRQQWK